MTAGRRLPESSLEATYSRFLTAAECSTLAQRVANMGIGGGHTRMFIRSSWLGNVRVGRNRVTASGDMRDNYVGVTRTLNGGQGGVITNQIDDAALEAAVRRAEHLMNVQDQHMDERLQEHTVDPPDEKESALGVQQFIDKEQRLAALHSLRQTDEVYLRPHIFFDSTYQLDAAHRAAAVEPIVAAASKVGLIAAAYVQGSATGSALLDTAGTAMYYPYTQAQLSITVRDPAGTGSGWAGIDWNDWDRIDVTRLSDIAIDKCLRSRNPVAVEPGRYTTILEPQAVRDFCGTLFDQMDRNYSEGDTVAGPYSKGRYQSKIGERMIDPRISVGADPMDPDLGFAPFSTLFGAVYHPAMWFTDGVLTDLPYFRPYAVKVLGKNSGLPNSFAYHMRVKGPTATLDEMIATTKRGVYVTRFSQIAPADLNSGLLTGYTRDGLWLVENGKISKPIKNFRFTESPLFVLNNVDQLGVPQRVFSPQAPAVYPAMKVRDFNFTSLSESV